MNTPTQIINTALSTEQRLSAYLSLKGYVGYRCAKLAGFVVAERHKEEVAELSIDKFNEEIGDIADKEGEAFLAEAAGLAPARSIRKDLEEMVGYLHFLNFECIELLPTKAQTDPNTKVRGIALDEAQLEESFRSTIALLGEGNRISETYEEYLTASKDASEEFVLTQEEWLASQEESENLWAAHPEEILDTLMSLGTGEIEFEDLSARAQIGIYENLLGKLPKIFESQMKRFKYTKGTPMEKSRSLASLKGLILVGMKRDIAAELNHSRYAGMEEFMYSFQPVREGVKPSMRLKRGGDVITPAPLVTEEV